MCVAVVMVCVCACLLWSTTLWMETAYEQEHKVTRWMSIEKLKWNKNPLPLPPPKVILRLNRPKDKFYLPFTRSSFRERCTDGPVVSSLLWFESFSDCSFRNSISKYYFENTFLCSSGKYSIRALSFEHKMACDASNNRFTNQHTLFWTKKAFSPSERIKFDAALDAERSEAEFKYVMKCDTPETGNKFLNIFHVALLLVWARIRICHWPRCSCVVPHCNCQWECTQLLRRNTIRDTHSVCVYVFWQSNLNSV